MSELDRDTINIALPKPVGILKINESLTIQIYTRMPNRFHRWMAKILLGWTYIERSEDAEIH